MKQASRRYQKENESGRTMVEMFSVVVLVGALTLIGLKGLGLSRDFLKANQVSQAVLAEEAALLSNRKYIQGRLTPPATGIEKNLEGIADSVHVQRTKTESSVSFTVKLTGVDENVCERAIKILSEQISDYESSNCSEGKIIVTFKR